MFIIVDTEVGIIAGKVVGETDTYYVVEFGGEKIQKVEKQYVYEHEGQLYVQGHDL